MINSSTGVNLTNIRKNGVNTTHTVPSGHTIILYPYRPIVQYILQMFPYNKFNFLYQLSLFLYLISSFKDVVDECLIEALHLDVLCRVPYIYIRIKLVINF